VVTQSAAERLLLGICRYTLSKVSPKGPKVRKTYECVRVAANALDAQSFSDTDGTGTSLASLLFPVQSPDLRLQPAPAQALSAAAESVALIGL